MFSSGKTTFCNTPLSGDCLLPALLHRTSACMSASLWTASSSARQTAHLSVSMSTTATKHLPDLHIRLAYPLPRFWIAAASNAVCFHWAGRSPKRKKQTSWCPPHWRMGKDRIADCTIFHTKHWKSIFVIADLVNDLHLQKSQKFLFMQIYKRRMIKIPLWCEIKI